MNLGVWAAIMALLVKLWGLFRGKGYRADVTIRSEEAIEAENKKLDNLKRRTQEAKDELTVCTLGVVAAKRNGLYAYARQLNDKRMRLLENYSRCRQEFLDAGGHADQIR